jgi:hypothetical protein
MIWKYVLGTPPKPAANIAPVSDIQHLHAKNEEGEDIMLATFQTCYIYGKRPPLISQICVESRQVAISQFSIDSKRLKDNRRRWETESLIKRIRYVNRDTLEDGNLLRLLDTEEYFAIGHLSLTQGPGRPSLHLSLIDFLLAARDHQVKFRHFDELIVKTTLDRWERSKPYQTWTSRSPRLVDLREMGVFRDLARLHLTDGKSLNRLEEYIHRLGWDPEFSEALRASILKPIQTLWQSLNKKQAKGCLPILPPLPKIDVVLSVSVIIDGFEAPAMSWRRRARIYHPRIRYDKLL